MTIGRQRLWRYRLTAVGALLALFGLATALIALPTIVSAAAAVAGATLSVLEIRANHRRRKELRFQARPGDTYQDVVRQSKDLGTIVKTVKDVGVLLASENAELRRHDVPAAVQKSEYKLPRELRSWSLDFLSSRARAARIHNDLVLGLASDFLADGVAMLRPGRYFDYMCSNLLAPFDVCEAGRRSPYLRGRDLILDRHGRLISFKRSRLANPIGVSTLAFTTDGQLLVVAQTPENINSPGLLAPSGSGALEPKDALQSHNLTLQDVIMNGAERELREECHLERGELGEHAIVGHGRWISRGAMPEFCGATLLHLTADQALDRTIRRVERTYVHDVMALRLTPAKTWNPGKPLAMLPDQYQLWASWPLAFGLACLAECMNDEEWPLRKKLLARLED